MKITQSLLAAALVLTPLCGLSTTQVSAKTISITKYGAKGNDKKDDTKAIQKALDANKNGTVTIPKGTYYSQVLYLRGNTTLKLAKGAVMKKLAFKKHPEDAWVIFHPKKKGYNGFKKVTITGGIWDGQVHKNNKTSEHKGFELDHGQNVTITNTTLKNMSGLHMIEVNACKNVKINHVTFMNQYFYSGKNHSSVAKYTTQTCEALQFDSATKGAAEALPLDGTICQNYTITNNTFKNVQSGLGSHHNESKYWKHMHKNIVVKNNTFSSLKGDAIHMNNINGATIQNNTCTSGGQLFLTLYHSTNMKVSQNKASGFRTALAMIQGTTATIANDSYTSPVDSASPAFNVFMDHATATISHTTIDAKVKGNVVANNGSNLTLSGCTLSNTKYHGKYGFVANAAGTVNITGCNFAGNGSLYAMVLKGGNFTVTNNTATDYQAFLTNKGNNTIKESNNNV